MALELTPYPEYVLDDDDINRIFSRTGEKDLTRVKGFSHNTNQKHSVKVDSIGRFSGQGEIVIQFVDTGVFVAYAVYKI
jgi:hypothetical protein